MNIYVQTKASGHLAVEAAGPCVERLIQHNSSPLLGKIHDCYSEHDLLVHFEHLCTADFNDLSNQFTLHVTCLYQGTS
jgi:hypothetical protein